MLPAFTQVKHWQRNEHLEHSLKFSFPQEHKYAADEATLLLPPYSGRPTRNCRGLPDNHRLRPQSWDLSRKMLVSLAAAISVFSVFFLWAICKASHSKEQQSGALRRRLAASKRKADEEELSLIADQCAALEAEMGVVRPLPETLSDMHPRRKIAKLASMLREAAAAHEQVAAMAVSLEEASSTTPSPETTVMALAKNAAGSQSTYRFEDGGDLPSQIDPLMSSAEADASEEYLAALEPFGWVRISPSTSSELEDQESDTSPSSLADEQQDGEPSTSASVTQQYPEARAVGAWDIADHPFARVPVLEPNVRLREIRTEGFFSRLWTNVSVWNHFLIIRSLFAKATLNQEDVNILMRTLEKLIDDVWIQFLNKARRTQPALAAAALGQAFLAFDYIVSAIQLFGDAMQLPLWWEKFISVFPTDYSVDCLSSNHRERVVFNTYISKRLLDVLNIYKTGTRPNVEEVVELKRLLFCFPHSPKPFRDSHYDPWREDDKNFMKYGH
ncbi:hypothetical protein, conserved [Eimeria necatrix]|uniref:Uncharacterized protein n=1 Tax=Eimeria necatrix TaxID=51315 RepID=U6N0Z1_9EIME|nr:hypothetical protein, conserved [Eimeria necatrix]CDJ68434.1 hypothetical protein, conserved [Eimeria necatrix]